jgi:uncharacterized protein YkwD
MVNARGGYWFGAAGGGAGAVNEAVRDTPQFCGFVALLEPQDILMDETREAEPMTLVAPARLSAIALALFCAGGLAACSGAPSTGGGLAPGLVSQINAPGAQMDRQAALGIINQYRATRGVAPLTADPALDAQAQTVAAQYASTGNPPARPAGATDMRLSAGYTNFAETFSGWRNSPADADVLAQGDARRAGFAAVYEPNSAYGAHWVVLLGQ